MTIYKNILLALLASLMLTACFLADETNLAQPVNVKFATYNLSFDRDDFETLLDELQSSAAEQDELVLAYLAGELDAKSAKKTKAAHIIQIRNVAATIQKVRPDVLMLAEFNNDGEGKNKSALNAFQQNYLSISQSSRGAGNSKDLEPIQYPFKQTFATNTGKLSGFDLDKNGKVGNLPGDAWGFGLYHGQYAFALFSKYEIDTADIRTFQNFKWKDLPGAVNPEVPAANKFAKNRSKIEPWYDEAVWDEVLLSSKNHVDVPVLIPSESGTQKVHLLLSHPTPPAFDTGKNIIQNAAEVEFWHHYINDANFIYDDKGRVGGLLEGDHFVIMGDLNLDTQIGNGKSEVMQALHQDILVNQVMTYGALYPSSAGAAEYGNQADPSHNAAKHPYPERITSEFGLAVDYALPSASIAINNSGVFWPDANDENRLLIEDARIGEDDDKYKGKGKNVNSDHRMVWFTADFH